MRAKHLLETGSLALAPVRNVYNTLAGVFHKEMSLGRGALAQCFYKFVTNNGTLIPSEKTTLNTDVFEEVSSAEELSKVVLKAQPQGHARWVWKDMIFKVNIENSGSTHYVNWVRFPFFFDMVAFCNTLVQNNTSEFVLDKFTPEKTTLYLGEAQNRILNEIKFWSSRAAWYSERKIPYKRSYLLKGPPGTGKSSFCKYVGECLVAPVTELDLDKLIGESKRGPKKQTVRAPWLDNDDDDEGDRRNEPRNGVIIIEDIDRVRFDQNEKGLEKLLNYLSGVKGVEGAVIFMTCNDESKLPDALLRPGRVDRILEFGPLDEGGLKHISQTMFGAERVQETLDKWAKHVAAIEDKKPLGTAAEFTEFCVQQAMEDAQKEFDKFGNADQKLE